MVICEGGERRKRAERNQYQRAVRMPVNMSQNRAVVVVGKQGIVQDGKRNVKSKQNGLQSWTH
ncbi:hypothetical protein N7539_007673 [Penicillium diatomitis]|uniref:Uncharacterized protein n=1 Tax=Penicillium diatomitis TaxID=2819901 RepID=A0A9X0BP25_9EURO|nr:uncharacterized protein N7539_007673 [Penicillium diatomitis]KAJ5477529.1 hypothetical protein N7539_007673 [Penicillium diatomitis]